MERRTKIILSTALAVGLAGAAGTGIAVAGDDPNGDGDDGTENEAPLTGEALEKASAAALEHTGGGEVTDTEADDEESAYEVEVTLDDGSEVDVQLDESFAVVGDETDGPNDDDGPGDD